MKRSMRASHLSCVSPGPRSERRSSFRPGAVTSPPRVSLLVACLVDTLFPHAGRATVELLERLDVEVTCLLSRVAVNGPRSLTVVVLGHWAHYRRSREACPAGPKSKGGLLTSWYAHAIME